MRVVPGSREHQPQNRPSLTTAWAAKTAKACARPTRRPQVGLLDPAGLPVTGAEQAVKQREVSQGVAGGVPSNGLVPKEA